MCKARTIASKKHFFSLNHQIFCWSPKSPLKVPWRSGTLGPLGDLQGTSPGCRKDLKIKHSVSSPPYKIWETFFMKKLCMGEQTFLGKFFGGCFTWRLMISL